MSFKMFRYLTKYQGKYRVKAKYDLDTNDFPQDEFNCLDDSFDDLYIPCRIGEIRHTYRTNRGSATLCVYIDNDSKGRNLYQKIRKKYSEEELPLEVDDIGRYDYILYFDEEYLDKIAEFVIPNTSGAKIKPYSVKNLPKVPYEIPEKDLKLYNDAADTLKVTDKFQRAIKLRNIFKDFDEVIMKEKGPKYNLDSERRASKLSNKNFIHSIGMWDQFIEFIKNYKE